MVVAAGIKPGLGAGDIVAAKGTDNHADPLAFWRVNAGVKALALQIADQLLRPVRVVKGANLQVNGCAGYIDPWCALRRGLSWGSCRSRRRSFAPVRTLILLGGADGPFCLGR